MFVMSLVREVADFGRNLSTPPKKKKNKGKKSARAKSETSAISTPSNAVSSQSDNAVILRVQTEQEHLTSHILDRMSHSMAFSVLTHEDLKNLPIIHERNAKENTPVQRVDSQPNSNIKENIQTEVDYFDSLNDGKFLDGALNFVDLTTESMLMGSDGFLLTNGPRQTVQMPPYRSISPILSNASSFAPVGVDCYGYDFETLHMSDFLWDESVRLRRRDTSKSDAKEAGFEDDVKGRRSSRISTMSRTQSTHILGAYSNSQFSAQDLFNGNSKTSMEYAQPTRNMAVVGPRRADGGIILSQSNYEFSEREVLEHRRSVQNIQAAPFYKQGYCIDPSGGDNSMPTHLVQSTNRDQYSTPIPSGNGRNTPQMRRRSVNMMTAPLAHSTPLSHTKISTVAPQPHRSSHRSHRESDSYRQSSYSDSRRGSAHGGAFVLPTYHAYKNNGETSGRHYSQEIVVDEPPSPKDPRVASLEQRVRELESAVSQGSPVTSSRLPQTHVVIANTPQNQMTQQLMAKDIVDKELEIERLQTQLRKTYSRMEMQQVQYDEEVRTFKKDSETAKDELIQVKNRLNALEKECNLYKSKAASMDATNSEALVTAHDKYRQQEKEISRLRLELESVSNLKEELKRVKEELAYLEVQNEALNSTLDSKEDTIKELETSMVTMRLEQSLYQQSCSSGSTPLADDCQSLADVHRPFEGVDLRKPYTKAHSTVGASLSPSPAPKNIHNAQNGGGLAKSLSNYHLHERTAKGEITPAISQLMRQQQKRVLDCRLLVRCLKESAEKAVNGETPDVSRLLGLKTDSMSESEAEHLAADSSSMSMSSAEKHMRRQEDYLSKLERDLEAVRASIQTIYQRQLRNDMASGDQDEACRIQ